MAQQQYLGAKPMTFARYCINAQQGEKQRPSQRQVNPRRDSALLAGAMLYTEE